MSGSHGEWIPHRGKTPASFMFGGLAITYLQSKGMAKY